MPANAGGPSNKPNRRSVGCPIFAAASAAEGERRECEGLKEQVTVGTAVGQSAVTSTCPNANTRPAVLVVSTVSEMVCDVPIEPPREGGSVP